MLFWTPDSAIGMAGQIVWSCFEKLYLISVHFGLRAITFLWCKIGLECYHYGVRFFANVEMLTLKKECRSAAHCTVIGHEDKSVTFQFCQMTFHRYNLKFSRRLKTNGRRLHLIQCYRTLTGHIVFSSCFKPSFNSGGETPLCLYRKQEEKFS